MTVADPAPQHAAVDLPPAGADRRGMWWAFGLTLAALAISLAHLRPALLDEVYPLATAIVAVGLLRDRRSGAYLEFVLWTWVLSPEVRRIVDWRSTYHSTSPIILSGAVATLVSLPVVFARWRQHPPGALGGCLLTIGGVVFYGMCIGVLKDGASPAVAATADSLPPVCLGLYLLVAGPPADVMKATIRRFFLVVTIVLGGYALVQFLVLPGWDKYWMLHAPINSDGFPHPFKVRVWSTLNSPAPFGTFIVCTLIPLGSLRTRWRLPALILGSLALGLSLVRTAWIGWAVSLALLLGARPKAVRRIGVRLVVPLLALLVVGGPIESAVIDRFTSTTKSGAHDESLQARLTEYGHFGGQILSNPVGQGLGSTGSATKLSGGSAGQLGQLGNFDGGFLVIGYDYGLIGGLVLVGAFGVALASCRRLSDDEDGFSVACLPVLYGLVVQQLFSDSTTSAPGILVWTLIAYVAVSRRGTSGDAALEPVPTSRDRRRAARARPNRRSAIGSPPGPGAAARYAPATGPHLAP